MPPVTPGPQGSRAGLITALVIFVILFVTATICSIYYGTNWQAEIVKHDQDVKRLAPMGTAADLNATEVQQITQDAQKRKTESGIVLALNQRDAEAKLITGIPSPNLEGVTADTARAIADVKSALKGAKADVTIGDDNLLASLRALSQQIVTLSQNVAQAQAETKAAQEKVTEAINARQAALAEKDKKIEDAAKATEEAKGERDKLQAIVTATAGKIEESGKLAIAAAQAQTEAVRTELTRTQGVLKKSMDSERVLAAALAKYRLDTTRPMMQPAALVTRVPSNTICFISLGEGQAVSPGLTFEVYDKNKGLPALTATNTKNNELPEGKASIEVIRVLPGTSECRIIRTSPGYHIVEGDLLLNLVYNTHAKFNFVVYGDFDVANTGQPTPGDADIIRRLITQWGGQVQAQVTPDTDFLVLGKAPTTSALPENATPLDQERHEKAVRAEEAYGTIQSAATHLTIPVLNQNRFLYFVGYYDQAKR